MATTQTSDLVIASEILQPAIAGAFAGIRVLAATGAAVINGTMPGTKGGKKIVVPYFGTLGEFADVTTEGDGVVPRKLDETLEEATMAHSALGFEQTMFSRLVQDPASDAYQEAARQIAEAGERLADQKLIDVATASLPAMTKDVYNAVTPRTFDYDLMVDAKMLWGDEQDNVAALVMHSKTFGDLLKIKINSGEPLLVMPTDGSLPRFMGVPIFVSDRMTVSSDSPAKYTTLLLKKRALVFWYNGTPRTLGAIDPSADTELTFVHLYYVAYRYAKVGGRTKGGVVIIKHN